MCSSSCSATTRESRSEGVLADPAVDPDAARRAAQHILSDRRFRSASTPRPFRGPLQWLGDRLESLLRPIGDVLDRLPWWIWVVAAVAVVGAIVWTVVRRRRTRGERAGRVRSERAAPDDGEDPAALERAADEAERAGDLERAVRLRFRAGLLRLGNRGAIAYRPSVTTGEVRRTLDSPRFDDLAGTFEAVTYGGRVGRSARRRRRASRVAARARGEREPVTAPTPAPDRAPPAGAARPTGRAKSERRLWIGLAVVVAGVIVVNILAQGVDRAVGGDKPGGATGSSYATAPGGLAALASLLAHYDHEVTRDRGSIAGNPLPLDSTVFLIEPDALTRDDSSFLLQFVAAGGRLVVGGQSPFYLHNLSDNPPTWQSEGTTVWSSTAGSLGGVREIDGAGNGSWASTGAGDAVVGIGNGALLTRQTVGRGEIDFLADASPLENAYLASADNAAFALALAGDVRPVVFPEGIHGYGAQRGLAAIPDRWKIALALVGLAIVAFVSVARPPLRPARPHRA